MKKIVIFFCLCVFMSGCTQKQNQGEIIVMKNGEEIPIKACVQANTKILGNSVEPIAFCKCLIPKLYEDLLNDPEKLKLLQEGNWTELSKEKQVLVIKYYEECMTLTATNDSTAKFKITPRTAEGMKKKMKQELSGTELEKTNDINAYCDCMINSMQTDFTVKEIMKTNFKDTEKYQKVVEKCVEDSKKNKISY